MPIHEYQCNKCGYIFEEITPSMDVVKASTECPECANKAVKIMSGGTVFNVLGYNSNNGYSGNMW